MTPDLAVHALAPTLVRADEPAPADSPTDSPTTWVVVSAPQPLVAESLRAALVRLGFDVHVLSWPTPRIPTLPMRHDRPRAVGIALVELATETELEGIGLLVDRVPVRWIVQAHRGPNPLWGAALDRRAATVLPSSTGLAALVDVIGRAARGERLLDPRRAEALRAVWLDLVEVDTLRARIRSLSVRESDVLRLLYTGVGVREIAASLGVSESTVRTHVTGLLRKLGVASRLAAVAAYDEYLDRATW